MIRIQLAIAGVSIALATFEIACTCDRSIDSTDTGIVDIEIGSKPSIFPKQDGQSGTASVAGQGGRDDAMLVDRPGERVDDTPEAGQGGRVDTALAGKGGQDDAAATAGIAEAGGASEGGGSGGSTEASCLDDITDYGNEGPFTFENRRSGALNFWIPNVPVGCKVPMVHLATGTGASCIFYEQSLERLATHGFLALCYETPQYLTGTFGMQAFETALAEYPDLADYKFGTAGHEIGGGDALFTLQLAEAKWGDRGVYATLGITPFHSCGDSSTDDSSDQPCDKIKSPVFMFSSLGLDGFVPPRVVQALFDSLSDSVEAYYWAKEGLQSVTPMDSEVQHISIPWFRWKLLGDPQACKAFKAILNEPVWTEAAVQNELPCD